MTKNHKLENMNESIQTAVSDPVYTKAVKEMLDYPTFSFVSPNSKVKTLKVKSGDELLKAIRKLGFSDGSDTAGFYVNSKNGAWVCGVHKRYMHGDNLTKRDLVYVYATNGYILRSSIQEWRFKEVLERMEFDGEPLHCVLISDSVSADWESYK